MREKLNDNPMLQIAVLGVLAVVVGLFVMMRMGGGAEEGAADPALAAAPIDNEAGITPGVPAAPATPPTGNGAQNAAAPAPGAEAPAAAAPATSGVPATPATPVTPPAETGSGNGEGFQAGPGLPKDVAAAYDDGKVVAILVVRGNGGDDLRMERIVEGLRSRDDTAVFIVKAFDIADYSRIAQGVNVQRTPALIVVQPKRLAEGPLPTASISYGFRSAETVQQAIRDALYNGPTDLPYYPAK